MKKRDPGKVGRWEGPPVEGWAEFEKVAILRAWEEIPRFPDAEEVGLKAMALLLSRWRRGNPPKHPKAWLRRVVSRLAGQWRRSQRGRVVSLEQRREERGEDLVERMDLRRRSPEYQMWLEEAREKALKLLEKRLTRRQGKALKGIFGTRTLPDAAREGIPMPRSPRGSYSYKLQEKLSRQPLLYT